ncbi:MAG: ACT domain-containing protein [Pseudomonadota bacterium]
METIAVYWEPKIRIYGLTTQTGLSLYTLLFPAGRLSYWGGVVKNLEGEDGKFELVNLQTASAATMQLCLIPALDKQALHVRRMLEASFESEKATFLNVTAPVELIYLHGPHFQDRYGIVEAVLTPLDQAQIPILASGCAGTSIYIVVSENRAQNAAACLSETFVL